MGAVGAAAHVGRIEQLGRAQAVAAAGRAVADADDAVRAVQIRDLVHVALALRALDDLHGLFPCDVVRVLAGFHEEFRDVAHADAHVAFDVAHAFAADALGLAARADHGAERVVFLQPVGQMFHGDGLRRAVDRLFHRDDVHADACAAGRDELRRQLQGLLGRQVEHRGDFRAFVGQGGVLHHVFAGTHDPLGDAVLDMMIRVVAVLLEDADPQQVVDDLLRFFFAHAGYFAQSLYPGAYFFQFIIDHSDLLFVVKTNKKPSQISLRRS